MQLNKVKVKFTCRHKELRESEREKGRKGEIVREREKRKRVICRQIASYSALDHSNSSNSS